MGEWPTGKWACKEQGLDRVYYLYSDGTFEYKDYEGYYVEGIWYIDYERNTVVLQIYREEDGNYDWYMEFGIESDNLATYPGKTTEYYYQIP